MVDDVPLLIIQWICSELQGFCDFCHLFAGDNRRGDILSIIMHHPDMLMALAADVVV
jgi:hypothetical protein